VTIVTLGGLAAGTPSVIGAVLEDPGVLGRTLRSG